MSSAVRVTFNCPHGERSLDVRDGDSIVDVCRRYGLPPSQLTVYRQTSSGELSLIVRPHEPIADYAGSDGLVLIPNRNIDYYALLGGDDVVHNVAGASTWLRTRVKDADGGRGFVTEYLRPSDAQAMVDAQVKSALEQCQVVDEPLVVGVSGGGDSNALLGAIVRSGLVSPSNVHPVMMMGIPDWDDGWERAVTIAKGCGLKLRTVSEQDTARILGFTNANVDWVTSFEQQFPGDDLEVLGVFAVRKVLEAVAVELGARRVVIGTNLEDCLADALYYHCAGQVPFPKPCGRMGRVDLVYPLWLTPKQVIDGCFPKFSLDNYRARYPSRMFGRAYFYYLAQVLTDAYPGAGQALVRGASALADGYFEPFEHDAEFDTPVASAIPLGVRQRLRTLFGTSKRL